ncbi:toxic anion resistance protein [Populibacterium corticicola]|uniref:Toxic anion resistance protein n=1 Tax=Populibacterium corticicola TaxID=1812826 RepID=A0ABW5XB47_9MICO
MTESAIPGINMAALLADPEIQNQAPQSPLEAGLAVVTPEDAAAASPAEAKFEFRSLLSQEQRDALTASAPAVAERMVKDYNQILNFGAPTLEKMNQASIALLNEQKDIQLPEADQIVNNLLREMDGYNAKYRNLKMEDFVGKVRKFFGGAGYTLKTMIRDAKPISDRLNEAEIKVREMELALGTNSDRARKLHEQTLETMTDVVAVLAALEEISQYLHGKFDRADALLKQAGETEQAIEFDGQKYSLSEFKEYHADLAQGISEIEKTWYDWRQQFFLGFASAPTLRNLILVSASMQRRLLVFRTQGIPSARRGLAMWQQAALAKQGSDMGESLQKGTNALIQGSFEASADAVREVSKAAQAPVITEETVFAVIDSVKQQAQSLIDADKWGRDLRQRNLAALERGEKEIATVDAEGRRQLVANAVAAASPKQLESAPDVPAGDILAQLGVQS